MIFTNSAKSQFWPGVAGPRPLEPPGVVIILLGNAIFLEGGVRGGCIGSLAWVDIEVLDRWLTELMEPFAWWEVLEDCWARTLDFIASVLMNESVKDLECECVGRNVFPPVNLSLLGWAGDGDVARYKSKSAPSCPCPWLCPELSGFGCCGCWTLPCVVLDLRFAGLGRIGGGVRGGETLRSLCISGIWKECIGNRSSSSELVDTKFSSGMLLEVW